MVIKFQIPKNYEFETTEIIDGCVVVILQEKEKPKSKLRLVVDNEGNLAIEYKSLLIGGVSSECNIYMLNTPTKREVYIDWVADGKPTSDEIVEWKNNKYSLEGGYLKNVTIGTNIYDFHNARQCQGCIDENILRYEHCNTPILH